MELVHKSITATGEMKNLVNIREFIKSFCDIHGIQEKIKHQIEIVLDEACANIIEHFYKEDEHKTLTVTLTIKDNRFVIAIESSGKRINLKYKDINLKKHFNARKMRGLGIFIMHKLMDEISYHYIPAGHQNILKLVKFLQ